MAGCRGSRKASTAASRCSRLARTNSSRWATRWRSCYRRWRRIADHGQRWRTSSGQHALHVLDLATFLDPRSGSQRRDELFRPGVVALVRARVAEEHFAPARDHQRAALLPGVSLALAGAQALAHRSQAGHEPAWADRWPDRAPERGLPVRLPIRR